MSKQSADIGIRLRPEDKPLKAELGVSLNAYQVLVLKKQVKTEGKLGI